MDWPQIVALAFSSGAMLQAFVAVWYISKMDARSQSTAKALADHIEKCSKKYEQVFGDLRDHHGELKYLKGQSSQEGKGT